MTSSEDSWLQTARIKAFLRHPDHTWKDIIKMQLIWDLQIAASVVRPTAVYAGVSSEVPVAFSGSMGSRC